MAWPSLCNHASHPASRSHAEILAPDQHRHQRIGGLRFRSDHAAEALTIAAISAAGARNAVGIAICLAGVRRRMRIRMIPEFLHRFLEQHSGIGGLQRGQRIFVHARPLENVAALDLLSANVSGLAADAHHLLSAPIVRFQIVVGDAPILHRQIFGQMRRSELFSQMRRQHELGFKETEGMTVPVLARAAHARAREKRSILPDGNGRIPHRVPMRDGLVRDVLHQPHADRVVELVHSGRIVGGFSRRAALQNQNRKRGAAGDFFRHREAGPAAADNRNVYRLECLHFQAVLYPITVRIAGGEARNHADRNASRRRRTRPIGANA